MTIFIILMALFAPLQLISDEPVSNVLLYTDPVQISSSINAYENIVPGVPIKGTVMVTYDEKHGIDPKSFRIGNKPLKVEFVQTVPMSSFSKLVISFYRFTLDGMNQGQYTLEPINVNVGGKVYWAQPLTIQVGS